AIGVAGDGQTVRAHRLGPLDRQAEEARPQAVRGGAETATTATTACAGATGRGTPAVTGPRAGAVRAGVDLQHDRGRALPAVAVGDPNPDGDRARVRIAVGNRRRGSRRGLVPPVAVEVP